MSRRRIFSARRVHSTLCAVEIDVAMARAFRGARYRRGEHEPFVDAFTGTFVAS